MHLVNGGAGGGAGNMQVIDGTDATGAVARHLVVAHQDNNTLAVYRLCVEGGSVLSLVASAPVPSAGNVCVMPM
jgi:predicted GNAT family N-acyltransferase